MPNAAVLSVATPEAPPEEVRRAASKRDRRPVERILPCELVDELRQRAEAEVPITAALAAALDRELAIHERFGVGPRRLRTFLLQLHSEGKATQTPSTSLPPDEEAVMDHRARQASAAAVIQRTFGSLADAKPELWRRHAYLLLVGLIYERLATDQTGIPTKELVSLAKILLDGPRHDAHRDGGQAGDAGGQTSTRRGPLPDRFADLVRQVYGTTLPDSAGSSSD